MTNIIKSLIAKTRKADSSSDIEALQRANETLQFRAQQIARTTPATAAAIIPTHIAA